MYFKKVNNLITKLFDEHIIVFDPNTGQTHCFDSNVNQLLNLLSSETPNSLSVLEKFFMQDCPEDEKTILSNYIQDMINNLLELKLIHSYS